MKPLSPRHACALVEVLRALEPDYRAGLRSSAMLYHALFGVPALSGRPRPSLEAANEAASAFLAARRAGIDLETVLEELPPEVLPGMIERLLDGFEESLDEPSTPAHPP